MSINWKWVYDTNLLDRCAHCNEPLRKYIDGGVIEYHSEKYHTHCLINKLTDSQEELKETPETSNYWCL